MFEEDENGDVLLVPTPPAHTINANIVATVVEQFLQQPIAPIEVESSFVEDVVNEVTEPAAPKSLWDRLFEAERSQFEIEAGMSPSTGLRRLRERRVNRTLDVVFDWLLDQAVGANGQNYESTLLNLAETIRALIQWPERDAQEALNELSREAQEIGR